LFWEEPRPRRGAASEAERRRAAGRRFGPEAVTEHDEELMWRDTPQGQSSRWVSRRCHDPAKQAPSPRLIRTKEERQSITDGTAIPAAIFTLKSAPFQRRSRHSMPGKTMGYNESGFHPSPHRPGARPPRREHGRFLQSGRTDRHEHSP